MRTIARLGVCLAIVTLSAGCEARLRVHQQPSMCVDDLERMKERAVAAETRGDALEWQVAQLEARLAERR